MEDQTGNADYPELDKLPDAPSPEQINRSMEEQKIDPEAPDEVVVEKFNARQVVQDAELSDIKGRLSILEMAGAAEPYYGDEPVIRDPGPEVRAMKIPTPEDSPSVTMPLADEIMASLESLEHRLRPVLSGEKSSFDFEREAPLMYMLTEIKMRLADIQARLVI